MSGSSLPDLSTILSRVTENPQAMSMLSSLLGGMSQADQVEKAKKEETDTKAEAESKESAPAMLAVKPRGNRKTEEKKRLLLALKPFLSPQRQAALETLVLVLEATSLLSFGKEPPCT